MANRLTDLAIKKAKPGVTLYEGTLRFTASAKKGKGKWTVRFMRDGKTREMGIGSYPDTSLADARQKAADVRAKARAGLDPIAERQKTNEIPTFGELADEFAAIKAATFRSKVTAHQWRMTMTEYAAALRDRPVDKITLDEVFRALKPLWDRIPNTASRVRGRIEEIFDAAIARGFRTTSNPAIWKGGLKSLLPVPPKLTNGHHAALPYDELPDFMPALRARQADSVAAIALEFAALTGARSSEVRHARWTDIDIEARVWTMPASATKNGREHRVPLSEPAVAILHRMKAAQTSAFVFPGRKPDRPLSPGILLYTLRSIGVPKEQATVHGFRSTLRDWLGDVADAPRELAEEALAHTVGNATERAYRRGQAVEKRRPLMEAFAAAADGQPAAENVVKFGRRPA